MLRLVPRSGLLLAVLLAGSPAFAQASADPGPVDSHAAQPLPGRLPADVTTHHMLELPGRSLNFSASAGAIHLTDARNAPRADIAFIAYQLDGAEAHNRPVTFVLNGGPGFASGWLQVGAVGPWRIPLGGDATAPSASPALLPNAETWLDFTDLVFIDPVDTGYSQILTANEDDRRRMLSVDGDIAYLAQVIRRWLDQYNRDMSPKYLLGESYGGFRAPRLTRELESAQGIGVTGMLLVSPALDIGGRSLAFDPFYYVIRLPSMAAAARAAHGPVTNGPVTRGQLADVEHYAATDFLLDATKGESDPAAIERRSTVVAGFTGLDPALVRRYHGLVTNDVFLRELNRSDGRIGSAYDATLAGIDPWPQATESPHADQVLERLKAPISSAMVTLYQTQLNWRPDFTYRLESAAAFRQWDWGHGMSNQPQSMSAMRVALGLDSHLHVLIAHGLFDLVTPYFGTQLLLNQLPTAGLGERVRLVTFAGGHMFYMQDASRAGLRDEARKLFVGQ
jgi:carboxypeptidase C (cathepsin A)